MNFDFQNSSVLLQEVQEEHLYEKLVIQIKKDFGLANIFVDFPNDVLPENLRSFLHEKIYYLILEKFSDYLNLLYVIDVPEKAFKRIKVTDVVEVAEQVSFLILKRELQKVWLKRKYSS
ncbi:hypothetical protein [Maribacter sp. HTCC2170]|uniref:hypothetical protein n=1 Tax=Maribacter sp. (strain HTCC2170 / KCCM 42371) TaxID=313603 RepID=UPI00006BD38D|nr:hypothetical protein [Maribacter sp. HTCC2170]EAR02274.1 hypothetical protein FB2170_03285 [Maribacter sp. HTCC2170]